MKFETQIIDRYLSHIGVVETPKPTLEFLSLLTERHIEAVPFENLDIYFGRPITFGAQAALEKIVGTRRGGFCFELNEAFHSLLAAIGFGVKRIEGSVWNPSMQRYGATFDHLALVVSLPEGEFLADVGFGDGNRSPIRIPDGSCADISGEYRISREEGRDLLLSRVSGSQPRPLFKFSPSERSLEAFEPMFAFHQTSPASIFTQGLICTKATPNGRITLSERTLTLTADGVQEKVALLGPAHCRENLEKYFGIQIVCRQS